MASKRSAFCAFVALIAVAHMSLSTDAMRRNMLEQGGGQVSAAAGPTDGSTQVTDGRIQAPNTSPAPSSYAVDAATGSGSNELSALPVGAWKRARTSWYGTPDWVKPYAATRGGGISAFGVLPWGGCGYTNGDGSLAFDKTHATAYSDDNPDWAGSCGRCYEIKCVNGPVVGPNNTPIPLEYLYYYPKFANVSDENGRAFPGNPTLGSNYYTVSCWPGNKTTIVKVVDMCPCYYCPEGQDCRYQESCCYKRINHPKAGQISMDVTFWAFQELAHPEYGIMMIDYRPVDCGSGTPIAFVPGSISRTLYSDMVGTGWAWFTYKTPPENKNDFNVTAGGRGVDGSVAACAHLMSDGAMTFWARGAGIPGFQPFSGTSTLSFAIKDVNNPGKAPPVELVISGDKSKPTNAPPGIIKDEPPATFCDTHVDISGRPPTGTAAGGYLLYSIPISEFKCKDLNSMNKLDFMTKGETVFCVDNVQLS